MQSSWAYTEQPSAARIKWIEIKPFSGLEVTYLSQKGKEKYNECDTIHWHCIYPLSFTSPVRVWVVTGACHAAGGSCWRPCFGRQHGRNDQSSMWPSTCKLFVFKVFFNSLLLSPSAFWLCSALFKVSFSESCLPTPVWYLTPKNCSALDTLTLAGFLLICLTLYLIYTLACTCTLVQWLQFEHSFLSSWIVLPNTPPSSCVITQET